MLLRLLKLVSSQILRPMNMTYVILENSLRVFRVQHLRLLSSYMIIFTFTQIFHIN